MGRTYTPTESSQPVPELRLDMAITPHHSDRTAHTSSFVVWLLKCILAWFDNGWHRVVVPLHAKLSPLPIAFKSFTTKNIFIYRLYLENPEINLLKDHYPPSITQPVLFKTTTNVSYNTSQAPILPLITHHHIHGILQRSLKSTLHFAPPTV